jgi:NAD(P)H-flavin reductase
MKPLALTCNDVDAEKGLIHFIIYERGRSSNLCASLLEGESVALMGPTGAPTDIPKNSNIMLIIEAGLGSAGLLPTYKALKGNNCRVIYLQDVVASKDNDLGKSIRSLLIIREGKDSADISINKIIAKGSAEFLEELQNVKDGIFGADAELIVSVNPPMQCMMQGVCGQCVLKVNGDKNYIFACSRQEQNAEIVDFLSLKSRLQQNSLQEKLQRIK